MIVGSYNGIKESEINAKRLTKNGKAYTLNHPKELIQDMRFKGENVSKANAQGWERSGDKFFNQLLEKHPEYFNKENKLRITSGDAPIVNEHFLKSFPQYREFKNEILIHHHIGGDGQAVAVPKGIHVGYGEIHVVENKLGIRDKAKAFTEQVKKLIKENPKLIGRTASEYKSYINEKAISLGTKTASVKTQPQKLSLEQWKKGINESSRAISKSAEKLIEAPVKGVGLVR